MIARYAALVRHPAACYALTGLKIPAFEALAEELLPRRAAALQRRRERPDRQRAPGAGHPFTLELRDQLLLTIVWLRRYPPYDLLGFFFGVAHAIVSRTIAAVLPELEAAGRDTRRMPDPGKYHRKKLETLLAETPEVAVIVDSFEQPVQRPKDRAEADRWYRGKTKRHTIKAQVAVDEMTGRIVDIFGDAVGPIADVKLLESSGLLPRLPAGVGALGDLASVGMDKWHPSGGTATPRRKPRGQPRPAADLEFNRAFARRRVLVEHRIGRLRTYQALSQADRHHRRHHARRVIAVAGLINRQLPSKRAA